MADQVCDNLTVNKDSSVLGNLIVKGNVGIGITKPSAKLHLSESGDQWSSWNYGADLVIQGNGRNPSIGILDAAGANPWAITVGEGQNGGLNFSQMPPLGNVTTPPNLRFKIDNKGNVGIGTTTPQSQLHLNVPGSGSPISAMTVDVQTFGTITNAQASSFFQVRDIGAEPPKGKTYFIINGLGNVGIGTTSPSAKLDVRGGDIHIEAARTFYSNGRMHISGEEILFLLNKDGVVIGREWGGNGNLTVEGDVNVSGDVILKNADCAEDFDIKDAESIEPGTVMVIDNDGALRASEQAYDRRVAGVISGAGDLHPGIMLDRQSERANRLPLALTGKVYCKVDAENSPIEVGDLLTTSSTIGHAMKVSDHVRSIGAIVGKALHPLKTGRGMIPILVALQ